MISRCSEARERTVNRSEWSSETTTDDTTAGYRRTPATSIAAMRTVFLVGPGRSRLRAKDAAVHHDAAILSTRRSWQRSFAFGPLFRKCFSNACCSHNGPR